VLGTSVFVGTRDAAVDEVERLLAHGRSGYVCFANVHLVEVARKDPLVRGALSDAVLVCPDGAPVAWLAHARAGTAERIAGSDVFDELCSRSSDGRYAHFFVGGTDETLRRLTDNVRETYDGIRVCGMYAPPFAVDLTSQAPEIARRVNEASADVVWVGLGAPKQEILMRELVQHFEHGVALGVGAVFDFASGTKGRAPAWMQKLGLEWAHRLSSEPRRLWRRYLVTNSRFLAHAAKELAGDIYRGWT
jgi:N-acetylglucosaminyldiphosphoundecaprenol N-acetyl-beta-D-mannosaminyltransferase